MTDALDRTIPGKAGLFFDSARLTESGWTRETAARARLERWCAFCGQPSCYGFGEFLHRDGILSCADPECVAQAEHALALRDAEDARQASPNPPNELRPVTPVVAVTDLFSRVGADRISSGVDLSPNKIKRSRP